MRVKPTTVVNAQTRGGKPAPDAQLTVFVFAPHRVAIFKYVTTAITGEHINVNGKTDLMKQHEENKLKCRVCTHTVRVTLISWSHSTQALAANPATK